MVAFSNPAAIIIIIGGTVGVGMASNTMSDIGPGIKAMLKMLKPGARLDSAAAVNELMGYADTARRDGLLALEETAKGVEDAFLRRGLELVIDGTDSGEVADVLDADIAAMKERHKVAAKFMADCGAYAPGHRHRRLRPRPHARARPHGRPGGDGPRHRVGLHRDALGHRVANVLLHPDRHEDEAHRRPPRSCTAR